MCWPLVRPADGRAAGRGRHRDRFARPDARAHRRHLLRRRARSCRLRAAGAQRARRARAAAARRGAGHAQALARGRVAAQGRAEHQVRPARAAEPRHRRPGFRARHDAAELCARSAPGPQPGEAGRAPSGPPGPELRGPVRQGRAPDPVRPGRCRPGHRVLGRGQRDDAARAPHAVAAARGRADAAHGLRGRSRCPPRTCCSASSAMAC